MNTKNISRENEKGSVLLITIVVLLVLSIIVIMGSNSSLFELKLAGNEKCIDQMRMNAESAAYAAIQNFEGLSKIDKDFGKQSAWNYSDRLDWYHQGEANCVFDPKFRGGDINNDGKVDANDGGDDPLSIARAYSQTFYSNDFGDQNEDNWDLFNGGGVTAFSAGSCDDFIPTGGTIPDSLRSLANSKFMVIDIGSPKGSGDGKGTSLGQEADRSKLHTLLVTGVDENCGGKYMVQMGIRRRF